MNYYNEFDPQAAAWLNELINRGLIPYGVVDTRSITEVKPNELKGYTQCHFFAGIGGWPLALKLAGWPEDKPVWTGSCPCQPFSAAGKGTGFADERHLWPHFHWLIENCRPSIVFGEQVASKDGLAWLNLVQADLEGTGYTSGAVDTCAAGFGAPHIRQRLYWVAYTDDAGSQGYGRSLGQHVPEGRETERRYGSSRGVAGGLADTEGAAGQHPPKQEGWCDDEGYCEPMHPSPTNGYWRDADWLFCRDGKWRPVEPSTFPLVDGVPARVVRLRGYGNAIVPQVAAEFIKAFTILAQGSPRL